MKTIILILTITLLVGCSQDDNSSTSDSGNTTEADTLTDAGNQADTSSETDTETDSVTTTDTKGETDTETDTGTVADTATETDTEADSGSPADSGTEPPAPTPVPKYQTMSVVELHAQMTQKDFLLINVHVPNEGEIDGTDEHIIYTNTSALVTALNSDKAAKAVLYCKTGPMSTKATKDLVKLGFYNIYDLTGGFVAWKSQGFDFTNP
ncbi:MAG TPA: rhodanese-like domain-containing protein [Myxococcales bacterium]|nr:rhodanese-like domain-containing protein [Myxococcales bacterium]